MIIYLNIFELMIIIYELMILRYLLYDISEITLKNYKIIIIKYKFCLFIKCSSRKSNTDVDQKSQGLLIVIIMKYKTQNMMKLIFQ